MAGADFGKAKELPMRLSHIDQLAGSSHRDTMRMADTEDPSGAKFADDVDPIDFPFASDRGGRTNKKERT
jgi:hypothetical protein